MPRAFFSSAPRVLELIIKPRLIVVRMVWVFLRVPLLLGDVVVVLMLMSGAETTFYVHMYTRRQAGGQAPLNTYRRPASVHHHTTTSPYFHLSCLTAPCCSRCRCRCFCCWCCCSFPFAAAVRCECNAMQRNDTTRHDRASRTAAFPCRAASLPNGWRRSNAPGSPRSVRSVWLHSIVFGHLF